ncbi:hypothetical protein MFMK1_001397 [Metallumcola ferriviriculae]|uniref:Uncharacterized protein n=1 Tax=Metallumcola ferriviriculae TaxID=3039180 RepID=A0AAU0UMI9_9FIRM|nr:hypothetical protein MFMK1_001397 [Desulfitibacteraceae bacterium MK1]
MDDNKRKRLEAQGIPGEELVPGSEEPVYTLHDGEEGPLSFDQNISQLSAGKREYIEEKERQHFKD